MLQWKIGHATKKEHKYNHQEWFNDCQTSAEVSLFRLLKIASKINPIPTDDSQFRKQSIQENLEWAFQHIGEHMYYSWINALIKGETSENDRKVLFKIENIKQDIKRIYEKIHEEMILANHNQENITTSLPDTATNTSRPNQQCSPTFNSSCDTNNQLLPILEKRNQELVEEIAANYKQLGYSLSEVDRLRINRQIKDLEFELADVENKISRSN